MSRISFRLCLVACLVIIILGAGAWAVVRYAGWLTPPPPQEPARVYYRPRKSLDSSGLGLAMTLLKPWGRSASLDEVRESWERVGYREIEVLDRGLARPELSGTERISTLMNKAILLHYEGEPDRAYSVLEEMRTVAESRDDLAEEWLFTVIYYQGLTALRRGETDNCVMCRGESACILPIAPAAYHTNPTGSRLAVLHFDEYLKQFPKDLEVRWLRTIAHMTLGEFQRQENAKGLIWPERYFQSEFDIGKFRDVGHLLGVSRLNRSGGAIMDDFDNDGLFDVVVSTWDANQSMALYRNEGDGRFADRTEDGDLRKQTEGLYCVQANFDNDGHVDVFVPRGAWIHLPVRPSLLRNNGDGTFTDVTERAGMLHAVNSISGTWADYDNDGFLDLFVCCERQANLLYHNRGDGTFEEVASRAGVAAGSHHCKGAAWVDSDNDGYPELFLTNLGGTAQFFRNNRNGTFTDVTKTAGITGPQRGFSCWAWDYDNDGWLDIFGTSYFFTLEEVVKGLQGQRNTGATSSLFRNKRGEGFEDVTEAAGLTGAYGTMGSNFGDFDNDGFLDMYLGTGSPDLAMLIPNRMFKNVGGKRFSEITTSSGTGQLQKGHGVACGDWDRDGDTDIFIQMGGATNGDRYHNILFQNPGQGNNWLSLKLIGKKTNRSAIGARIKVVTAGDAAMTVHRHVSSGSSFGANPLEQHVGLGRAGRVALVEVHWPTSGTTQVFRDVAVNQAIEITEFADDYREVTREPIPLSK